MSPSAPSERLAPTTETLACARGSDGSEVRARVAVLPTGGYSPFGLTCLARSALPKLTLVMDAYHRPLIRYISDV